MNTVQSSWAGIITAIAAVITALALLVGALPALLRLFKRVDVIEKQNQEIHTIVNQQRTDSQRYQAALILALERAGIAVPEDQSIEVAPIKE